MEHIITITKKPELSGVYSLPDGGIVGNGDLAAVLGNAENGLRIYLSKIDLWEGIGHHDKGGLRPLGWVDIPVSKEAYADYHVKVDMLKCFIDCRFINKNENYSFKITVPKGENSLIIESTGNMPFEPVLTVFQGETTGRKGSFSKDGIDYIFRSFDSDECTFKTHIVAGMKKINSGLAYLFTATNHDLGKENDDGLTDFVVGRVSRMDINGIAQLLNEHNKLWAEFWSKSSVTLSDKFIEKRWYASLYYIAVSSGNRRFAPGLFGNFVTVEYPSWHSDYHLNYNYQAPFYHVFSSNHPELSDTYHVPLEEFMENGRKDAEKFGCKGIILPVGIGPKGIYTEYTPSLPHWFKRLYLGQKSNAIHPADIMVFRWKATRDCEYAEKHAYPYIKECLQFFEDYAVVENGRYSVCDDSAHEVPMYREDYREDKYPFEKDKNNNVTMGMLRLCLEVAIDMANALDRDKEKVKIWQNMLDNLSPFPVTVRHFKKVFRYTEKGQRWDETGDVGLQHIYPAGCVSLSSDKKLLRIARNTFNQKKRRAFFDGNANSSFYPMAARLGMDPHEIIKKLKKARAAYEKQNLLYVDGGGGLEYCSIVGSTVNEMALQSFEGFIRLFPCWDEKIDCEYKTLRADGAFLVSSQIKDGHIGETEIVSEKGGMLKVLNPFDKASVKTKNGFLTVNDSMIEISTDKGDSIIITECK